MLEALPARLQLHFLSFLFFSGGIWRYGVTGTLAGDEPAHASSRSAEALFASSREPPGVATNSEDAVWFLPSGSVGPAASSLSSDKGQQHPTLLPPTLSHADTGKNFSSVLQTVTANAKLAPKAPTLKEKRRRQQDQKQKQIQQQQQQLQLQQHLHQLQQQQQHATPPLKGIPHREAMRRLHEQSGRRAQETCTDDSALFAAALGSLSPMIAALSSYLTCAETVAAIVEGKFDIAAMVAALGVPADVAAPLNEISCTNDVDWYDVCLALGQDEETCQELRSAISVSSTCCESCCRETGGDNCGDDNTTLSLEGCTKCQKEVEPLLEFIDDLQIVWWEGREPITTNLCAWDIVDCETDQYSFSWGTNRGYITGYISDKIGELVSMVSFEIEIIPDPILGSSQVNRFTSTLPSAMGFLPNLTEINLVNMPYFTGTIPASFKNLDKLASINIKGCGFSGELSQDLFSEWASITVIEISDNGFTGTIPPVDLSRNPSLMLYNASNNAFTSFGPSIDPSHCVLATDNSLVLDISHNKLTEFPEEIRILRHLGSLYMQNNSIAGIPAWGYWQAYKTWDQILYENSAVTDYQVLPCRFFAANSTTPVEPQPEWPLLTSVVLSGNPLGRDYVVKDRDNSLRRFLALFSQAPALTTMKCASCELSGEIVAGSNFGFRQRLIQLAQREGDEAGKVDCLAQEAFTGLQLLDMSANEGIVWLGESCDILRTAVDDDADSAFECLSCPDDSAVKDGAGVPLASISSCICKKTYELIWTEEAFECACQADAYKDPITEECTLCEDMFNCSWPSSNPARTKELPNLIAGYWMPCISRDEVTGDLSEHVYDCFHDDVCLGGSIDKDGDCQDSGDSLCAEGRTGIACALCKRGHYGDREGACKVCPDDTEGAQNLLKGILIGAIPVLYILIRLLGSDDSVEAQRAADAAAVEEAKATAEIDRGLGTGFRSSVVTLASAEKVTGRLQTVAKHVNNNYDSIGRAMMMVNLVFKSMQILALLLDLRISWPNSSKKTLSVAAKLGVNFDVIFQVGCLVEVPSAESSLLFKWVIPLVVASLTLVAWLLSYGLDRGITEILRFCFGNARAEGFQGTLKVNSQKLLTFLFYIWSSFFAGLVKNSFAVFVCRENPNGKDTVLGYPSVVCGTDTWFLLTIGGTLSCIFYVVCYFAAAIVAFHSVAAKLKETQFKERGAFTFAVENLRTAALYWNIYAAGRDVTLNILVALLVSQPGSQLLCASFVLLYYAKQVWTIQPYSAATLNFVEWWFSVCVAVLLVVCCVFGFQSGVVDGVDSEGAVEIEEIAILILLFLSVGVPVCCAIFEVLCIIPCIHRSVPDWARTPSDHALKVRIDKTLKQWSPEQLHKCLGYMDLREWSSFTRLIWGYEGWTTDPADLWTPEKEKRRSLLRKFKLEDTDLATVHSRQMVIQRQLSLGSNSESTAKNSSSVADTPAAETQEDGPTKDKEIRSCNPDIAYVDVGPPHGKEHPNGFADEEIEMNSRAVETWL